MEYFLKVTLIKAFLSFFALWAYRFALTEASFEFLYFNQFNQFGR